VEQVLTARHPFQIGGAVVILVAIDMIDLRTLEPCVRMPRHCHEAVDIVVHAADFDIDVMLTPVRDAESRFQYLARQYFAVGLESDMRPDASCLAPDETGVGCLIERQTGDDFPLHNLSLDLITSPLPVRDGKGAKKGAKTA